MLVYLASFDHHRTAQCHKIGRLAVILCELNLRSDRQLLFVLYVVRIYDVLRRHKVHHIHRDTEFCNTVSFFIKQEILKDWM